MSKHDLADLFAIADWARDSFVPDAVKVRSMLEVFDRVRQRLETKRGSTLIEGHLLAMFVSSLSPGIRNQLRITDHALIDMAYRNAKELISIETIEVTR